LKNRLIASESGALNDANAVGKATPGRVVDLNRATREDLESLPGIGAVLAERVIVHRAAAGRFHMVEDLRAVKGIGSRKFDRIKPLVTVGAADARGNTEKQPL
jgi:competence protein ComEA